MSRLGVLFAVALCLLAPAAASAQQPLTLGSPLTAEPNVAPGCEAKPTLVDYNGNYAALPSGTADCTWSQSGVFGAIDFRADPRTRSVPGTGRITQVSVRS